MGTPSRTKARNFSFGYFLLWWSLFPLCFGLFRLAIAFDSKTWFVCGICCVAVAMITALVTLQRVWKYTILVLSLSVCIYTCVYTCLSLNGRYEGAVFGAYHVKWYSWAPLGFVHDLRENQTLVLSFGPLYYLDLRFWHRDVQSDYSGPYPINRDPDQRSIR